MNPNNCLDFEKPIAELEAMLKELRHLSAEQDLNITMRSPGWKPRARRSPIPSSPA
jgi:hypothetical protein